MACPGESGEVAVGEMTSVISMTNGLSAQHHDFSLAQLAQARWEELSTYQAGWHRFVGLVEIPSKIITIALALASTWRSLLLALFLFLFLRGSIRIKLLLVPSKGAAPFSLVVFRSVGRSL